MPWGDRTGPVGAGPRTGRGLGYCSGNTVPGYMVGGPGLGWGRGFGRGWGRGFGRGWFGRGRGWGWHWWWPGYIPPAYGYSKDDEKRYLETEIDNLTKTVEALKNRLKELDEEND